MKKLVILVLLAFVGIAPQSIAQAKITFKAEVIDYGEIAKVFKTQPPHV
jgi:hypothetical protein